MKHLHIYSQVWPHSDAFIVGEQEALEQLRDAITRALERGSPEKLEGMMVNDGEGFDTYIIQKNDDWDYLAVPYTDEHFEEGEGSKAFWPTEIIIKHEQNQRK